MHYISILSTLITFLFAAAVFARYRFKKGPHLLMWGTGLIFYGLGTLTEVILSFTYSELALRVWYLAGAMLTAAWLGQGTVFLLVRKGNLARAMAIGLALVSLVSLALVFLAPVQGGAAFDVSSPVSIQYKSLLTRTGPLILLTILLNIYGTVFLVGGALYSAFLFWRKQVLAGRMLGNIWIALGALLPALAGSLLKAGLADFLYVSEFLGVILMFAGFLQATSGKVPAPRPVANV